MKSTSSVTERIKEAWENPWMRSFLVAWGLLLLGGLLFPHYASSRPIYGWRYGPRVNWWYFVLPPALALGAVIVRKSFARGRPASAPSPTMSREPQVTQPAVSQLPVAAVRARPGSGPTDAPDPVTLCRMAWAPLGYSEGGPPLTDGRARALLAKLAANPTTFGLAAVMSVELGAVGLRKMADIEDADGRNENAAYLRHLGDIVAVEERRQGASAGPFVNPRCEP